jgi:hypothetical protein
MQQNLMMVDQVVEESMLGERTGIRDDWDTCVGVSERSCEEAIEPLSSMSIQLQ